MGSRAVLLLRATSLLVVLLTAMATGNSIPSTPINSFSDPTTQITFPETVSSPLEAVLNVEFPESDTNRLSIGLFICTESQLGSDFFQESRSHMGMGATIQYISGGATAGVFYDGDLDGVFVWHNDDENRFFNDEYGTRVVSEINPDTIAQARIRFELEQWQFELVNLEQETWTFNNENLEGELREAFERSIRRVMDRSEEVYAIAVAYNTDPGRQLVRLTGELEGGQRGEDLQEIGDAAGRWGGVILGLASILMIGGAGAAMMFFKPESTSNEVIVVGPGDPKPAPTTMMAPEGVFQAEPTTVREAINSMLQEFTVLDLCDYVTVLLSFGEVEGALGLALKLEELARNEPVLVYNAASDALVAALQARKDETAAAAAMEVQTRRMTRVAGGKPPPVSQAFSLEAVASEVNERLVKRQVRAEARRKGSTGERTRRKGSTSGKVRKNSAGGKGGRSRSGSKLRKGSPPKRRGEGSPVRGGSPKRTRGRSGSKKGPRGGKSKLGMKSPDEPLELWEMKTVKSVLVSRKKRDKGPDVVTIPAPMT